MQKRRQNQGFAKIAGIVFVALTIALAIGVFEASRFFSAPSTDKPLKVVFYDVSALQRPLAIARELEKHGVVSNARMFYWYARLTGQTSKFKVGDYRFTNKMTPLEVVGILTSGISFGFPITVPEGYNMYQVADIMEKFRPGSKATFLQLCMSRKFIASLPAFQGFSKLPSTLEGYLFPDTYLVERNATVENIIEKMVAKYRSIVTPELVAQAKKIPLNEHEFVTLASIVEKETGARSDRPLVASVFLNRLKKHMRLATDPTVIYGIKNFDGNIRRKDLDTYTPYNTYKIPGLPPGPISNPGRDAFLAVLNPADTRYLFFVSRNDGTTEFNETYEAHQKAVQAFQINRKAREGKSWRDAGKQ